MRRLGLVSALLCCLTCWVQASVSNDFIATNRDRLDNLFGQLDKRHPGLEEAVGQWQNGEQRAALRGVASYYRNRSVDLGLFEPAYIPDDVLYRSDKAMENTFYIHSEWTVVPFSASGGIDWDYRGKDGDKEIAWMLNRHVILPILAEGYRQSGQTGYRERLNLLLVDWITTSPYPDRITFSPRWRPLEAARRVLNSWIHVFHGENDLLDDETLLLVLSCIPEHADALYQHASFWGGNHLLTEKIALLALASAWPEFSESPKWKANAIEVVTRQLMEQSYPDGSYTELSNHYQRVVITNTLPFLKLLKHGVAEHGDTPVYERIEAMWNYFACATKPDGSGPMNNASDREDNARILKSAWEHFGRKDWLGIATNGKEGVLPGGQPSRVFPWAGHVFMRSDWGPLASWVYFDAGPYGTAHQHVDKLHLSVSLRGEDLLSDSGRYTYKPGKWKDYFQGPRSHSVILLNGQPSLQGPRKGSQPASLHFKQLDGAVYASSTAYFDLKIQPLRGPVPWTRHVILDMRGFVIVFDQLLAFRKYEAEVIWQFAPGINRESASRIISVSGDLPQRQRAVAGNEQVPVGGFSSSQYGLLEPAVQLSNFYEMDHPTTLCHVINHPDAVPVEVRFDNSSGSGELQFQVLQGGEKLAEGRLSAMNKPGLLAYEAL